MKSKLDDFLGNPKQYYDTSLGMFKKLYQLEVLMEDWEQQVDEAALMLYGKDEKYYASLCREFEEWLNSERPVIKTAVGSGSAEKRWDFTACMSAYNKYKDKATGYYPLNDDLKFMLETLYVGQQWKNNIFVDVANLNEDMAWMFCCYYEA